MTEKDYAADDWLIHLGEPEPIPIDRPRLAEKPVEVEPSRRRDIPYRTPLEVAASTSEHPDWLLRGYLALGAITEVDGKMLTRMNDAEIPPRNVQRRSSSAEHSSLPS